MAALGSGVEIALLRARERISPEAKVWVPAWEPTASDELIEPD